MTDVFQVISVFFSASLNASQLIWFEGHEPKTDNKPNCLNYGNLYLSLSMLQSLDLIIKISRMLSKLGVKEIFML